MGYFGKAVAHGVVGLRRSSEKRPFVAPVERDSVHETVAPIGDEQRMRELDGFRSLTSGGTGADECEC